MRQAEVPRTRTAWPLAGALWITWEHHRRTTELARAFDVPLREIVYEGPRLFRYLAAGALTIVSLLRTRPRIVFVQNPSVVLAAIVCALRRVAGYRVVVDRHSNFHFANTETGIFNKLSDFTLRHADLTIVTNTFVKQLAEAKGARAFVLPDKMPTLSAALRKPLAGRVNALFVCSYGSDEPVVEVIEAARMLGPDVHVYVTGRQELLPDSVRRQAPSNVVFTGYLPTAEYESLLASVDLVLELTTRPHTLLCGAYEAVSMGKPLVISRTDALMEYFRTGVVGTDNVATAIAEAVAIAAANRSHLQQEIARLRADLSQDWQSRFQTLQLELTLLMAQD